MSLILRVPGVSFTDTTIPILRNDSVANAGTLDIFDALDADISWPKQADPVEGSDTWKSLIGAVPNLATFSGSIGWSGGFTTNSADTDMIELPNTFRFSGTDERCVIFWVKPGTAVDASPGIFGWKKTGTGDSPYLAYLSGGTTIIFTQGQGGAQIIASEAINVGVLRQYAFSFQHIGGVYVTKFFKNGALVNTITGTATSMTLSGSTARLAGSLLTSQKFVGTFLRAVSDDLSASTPEALVALDYATHQARLAAA